MNEAVVVAARGGLSMLLNESGPYVASMLKVSSEDLIEAFEALTDVFIKYDKIPEETWQYLCLVLATGLKEHRGKSTNARSDLG